MPDKFQKWFNENSGYTLHSTARRAYRQKDCCGEMPQNTGKKILFQEQGRMTEKELYRCVCCGAHYVRQGESFCLIENLLKYPLLP